MEKRFLVCFFGTQSPDGRHLAACIFHAITTFYPNGEDDEGGDGIADTMNELARNGWQTCNYKIICELKDYEIDFLPKGFTKEDVEF